MPYDNADSRIQELEAELLKLQQENSKLEKENRDLRSISEDYLKASYDNQTALSISRFKDGVFLYMNDRCLKILGYELEEVIGKSVWELNIWVDFTEREVLLNHFSKQGYVRNFECRFRKKDGNVAVTLISSSIINVNGVKCMVISTIDITEDF